MIEDEEQPQLLNTIGEQPTEEVGTIEEDIYVLGVESLNGKTGDLSIKTINGEDLVEEGNIDLQTPLDSDQMAAVNSGIDAEKVGQIATNTQSITTLQNTKQDNLTQTQLNAVNSGIDQTKVAQIATNTGNITSNTNRITTIEGKIPSAASSSNQLTDKNYVDNSIATNTANYISDNGQPFQSLADLEAYSGPLTNNDYAFVVSTDAAGNLLYTRYKYNADQELWAEEYTIANPTFTSDQWAAINSGVTQNDVNQIGTNKGDIAGLQTSKQDALSQTQLDAINSGIDATKVQQIADNTTAIATKQDKLIAGANIQIGSDGKTISATDTTYTAGTGLTLTGTQFSVTEPVPAGFFTDTAAEQTGTGSSITLNNTVNAPIDGAELKGDTFQQTYSGKNILPITPASSTGLTISYDTSTGELSVSGTPTTQYNDISVFTPVSIPAGTVVTASRYITTISGSAVRLTQIGLRDSTTDNSDDIDFTESVYRTITTSKAITRARVIVRLYANEAYNFKIKVQLEIGNQSTSFEPYVGGVPSPNPSYPQDIQVVTGEQTVKVTGKNWLSHTEDNWSFSSANNQISQTASRYAEWGEVVGGQTYVMSRKAVGTSSYWIAAFFTSQPTIGSVATGFDRPTNYNTTSYSFNVPAGTKYVVIFYGSGLSEEGQLEIGSTATTYQPYQSQSYTIDLGAIELCKIGTYQDYIWKDGADWKIHKEIGKHEFDGTESVVYNSSGGFVIGQANLDILFPGVSSSGPLVGYSDMFTIFAGTSTWKGEGLMGQSSSGTFWCQWSGLGSSTAACQTWLATNKPILFTVVSATDTAITDATLIAQLEALASSTTYSPQTNYSVLTPSPNLPAILTVDVFKNNYAGLLARLEKAGA